MKRKILSIAICAMSLALSVSALTGCSLLGKSDEPEILEVATYAELKSAQSTENIVKLTADIDCDYETMTALNIVYLDGDGHTISNAVITSSSYTQPASFLGNSNQEVKNVTFDNVKVSNTAGAGAGVVSSGSSVKIENVTVKNCKVTCTQTKFNALTKPCYVGGIFGGSFSSSSNSAPAENENCEIINCTITDTEIEVNGLKSGGKIYAGGIAGLAKSIKDCAVNNVKVTAVSNTEECDAFVGGLVAITSGAIENCSVEGSSLTLNNTKKQGGTLGSSEAYGGDGYIGGICASLNSGASVAFSYAKNNSVKIYAGGEVYTGGIAGKMSGASVNQAYSLANVIEAGDNYVEGIKTKIYRIMGGFAGEVKNSNITSAFAYKNTTVSDLSALDKYCDGLVGGFIGKATGSTITKCAVNNTQSSITGYSIDEFSPSASGITESVVTATTLGNANGCEVAEEGFWSSLAITKLNLMGNKWSIIDELPQLTLR